MIGVLLLISISMFIYVNTLFYTIALLAVVVLLLYSLVANSIIHTLTMLMLLIVYVGAMIILIGYICAISPNLMVNTTFSQSLYLFGFIPLMSLFFDSKRWLVTFSSGDYIRNYFYSSFGLISFLFVVFILFVTLLMVTSQYLAPKGPFRSINL